MTLVRTAAVLAAMVAAALLLEGWSEDGVRLVIRLSARIAVIFFVAAFSASSLQSLHPSAWSIWLLKNRRQLGLSFALSHTTHLLALIALGAFFPDPFMDDLEISSLIGGGLGYAFLFAMAITSNDRAVARLGRKRWRLLHTVGSYYIWTLFALSYLGKVIESPVYAPFAVLIAIPVSLRALRRIKQSKRTGARP